MEDLRYLLTGPFAGAGAAGAVTGHGETINALGVTCSGFRLFLVSSALKSARSCDCIVFHFATVVLYSLQPFSPVSISACVGASSRPTCDKLTMESKAAVQCVERNDRARNGCAASTASSTTAASASAAATSNDAAEGGELGVNDPLPPWPHRREAGWRLATPSAGEWPTLRSFRCTNSSTRRTPTT